MSRPWVPPIVEKTNEWADEQRAKAIAKAVDVAIDVIDKVSSEQESKQIKSTPPPEVKVPPKPQPAQGYSGGGGRTIYVPVGDGDRPIIEVDLPPPPPVPPRQLPTEEDNQTATKTTPNKSITVKQSLTQRKFGRLLVHPFVKEAEVIKTPEFNSDKIEKDQKSGIQKFNSWFASQRSATPNDLKVDLQDLGLTLLPDKLKASEGDFNVLFGLKALHSYQKEFSKACQVGLTVPSGLIPLKFKYKDATNPKDTSYKSFDKSPFVLISNSRIKRIHELLGGNFWERGRENFNIEKDLIRLAKKLFLEPKNETEYTDNYKENALKITTPFDYFRYILAASYWKLGLQDFPSKLPTGLLNIIYTDKENKKVENKEIRSLLGYFDWYVDQFDALVGEWPISIDLEDADPLQEGAQRSQILLPNIAETLAEIWRNSRESMTSADVHTNIFMRLIPEILGIKNGTIITQDYVRAINSFLGYKGNPKKREITINFNPNRTDQLDAFLSETKVYLVGWENEDEITLMDYLHRLMFAAQITKNVHFRPSSQLEKIKDIADKLSTSKSFDQDWEEFIALLNNSTSDFNKNSIPKPKVNRDRPN